MIHPSLWFALQILIPIPLIGNVFGDPEAKISENRLSTEVNS